MLDTLKQLVDDPELDFIETLQELWSGYGQINRYFSPKLDSTFIVKYINPPEQVQHPRGWHSDVGHQRKLRSYQVETAFYQHYAQHCDQFCYVPQLVQRCTEIDNQQLLIMQDLQQLGFDDGNDSLTLDDINCVIEWLAHFHAKFLHNSGEGLWPIGSYWHLNTRQDELSVMQDGPLKTAASAIDQKLNNGRYQTLIHGDAKLANFCFGQFTDADNQPLKRVAAVDFQYVGKGVGVKDLAYFLGSCLTESDLLTLHESLLDHYFCALKKACLLYQTEVNVIQLEEEWRELYSFANADFLRFLQGWSPQHHKINSYLDQQMQLALDHLSKS